MFSIITNYSRALFSLVYPSICPGCNKNLSEQEKAICFECLYNIPKTNFGIEKNNPVEQIFYGRVPITHATAIYYYTPKGTLQKIIQSLKYKNNKLIGITLGKQLANSIKNTVLGKVDFIVPVPLHPTKQRKRGYNQSEIIAKGMIEVLPIKMDTKILYRKVNTDSQTSKSRYARWENVTDIFKVKQPKIFENKHILLIDDIVTTGATLEACAIALHKAKVKKISIVCVAKTQ